MSHTIGHIHPPENYRAYERATDKGRRRSTNVALRALVLDPEGFDDNPSITNPKRAPYC